VPQNNSSSNHLTYLFKLNENTFVFREILYYFAFYPTLNFGKIYYAKFRNIYLQNFAEFREIIVTKLCEISQNKF
jgi:hypothetical protein